MKNAAIYMRVNRNLDIRNQEMEEYLNACDNLVKAIMVPLSRPLLKK